MFKTVLSLVALAFLASTANAVTLQGTTHIDYYPEGNSSQFCCDGVAIYGLQYNSGPAVHFDYFSILDYANHPVWTISDFDVNFGGQSAGLLIDMIEDGGKDWLRLDGFPGFETTINPDLGENVYTEFGYSFIELPSLASVGVPEPASVALLALCLCGLALKR